MVEDSASGQCMVSMMTYARVLCDWMVTWVGEVRIFPRPVIGPDVISCSLISTCTAFTHSVVGWRAARARLLPGLNWFHLSKLLPYGIHYAIKQTLEIFVGLIHFNQVSKTGKPEWETMCLNHSGKPDR